MNAEASSPETMGVIGPGRFGSSLAMSLENLGFHVITRAKNHALDLESWVMPCQVLCLCVRDHQIEDLVTQLAAVPIQNKTILMHSGVTPLSSLKVLAQKGAVIGKFHPLQAFTQVGSQPIPQGTPFAMEGPIQALVAPWVKAWGGVLHELKGDQWQVYHLAAVLAANFLPLFIRQGASLLEGMTSDQQSALDWLAPLVRHSVEGALNASVSQPFSGPAIRRDQATIAKHLSWLQHHKPGLTAIYQSATERILKEK